MIDLFAGCGGLSLGFEMAGFEPLLFSEINLNAAQTYMLNRKGKNVTPIGDIYSLTDDNLRLLKESWKIQGVNDVDIVCGGPPCQGYSGIGHRRTFKLEKQEIPSNQLYQEMVRVINFVRPKVFLFENVKGLLSGRWTKDGKKGEIFRDVLQAFRNIAGYEVEWNLVHAKDYGVPQNRPRVLLVGYREDVINRHREPMLDLGLGEDSSPYNDGGNAVSEGF
ncbi:MAG: DNA (cytosine-5-)-methyltransferase, partial [Verrucomicrobiota bacterium]